MSRGTETRKLTEGVYVRFSQADYDVLRGEAQRRDITIAQLLREETLPACRGAGQQASVA
jgi:hypothetical protein